MSMSRSGSESMWQRCTRNYTRTLPVLPFPFNNLPNIFAPASTVLQFPDSTTYNTFLWCYLRREGVSRGVLKSFDASSLSEARVDAIPRALESLSKWLCFINARPRTIGETIQLFGLLLLWADKPEHDGRFETILSDSAIALEALKGYHTYLRNMLQNHSLANGTAAIRDQRAIACLSEIHGVNYKEQIEPLQSGGSSGRTKTPDGHLVGEFCSTLQALFDSASDIVLKNSFAPSGLLLRISSTDDSKTVKLRSSYGPLRLMELACVAYTGLVLADSGANLSVLQAYEEPDDLEAQLAKPDRVNLTQKAVKFRAGGKKIEVHLSATTITRLKTYLKVRQQLIDFLECKDIGPLFIRCSYDEHNLMGEPVNICEIDRNFLFYIRRKCIRLGVNLPNVTLRQLRAYKQQDLVRRAPVTVAAMIMGHSVKTAVQAYSTAQYATHRGEIAKFLGSLQKTIIEVPDSPTEQISKTVIPIGLCIDHGQPLPTNSVAEVTPDCNRVEGCFFCDNYRIHADTEDMRKLMSCRQVLKYIVSLDGDTVRASRIYTAVVDRIDSLLRELRRRQPETFENVRVEIEERRQLTRYWANKLQQLHLLGMLPDTPV